MDSSSTVISLIEDSSKPAAEQGRKLRRTDRFCVPNTSKKSTKTTTTPLVRGLNPLMVTADQWKNKTKDLEEGSICSKIPGNKSSENPVPTKTNVSFHLNDMEKG